MNSVISASLSNDLLVSWLKNISESAVLGQFLTLFDNEAFYILDAQQRVLFWSVGAEQLTSVNEIDILGQICPADFAIHTTLNNPPQIHSVIKLAANATELYQFVQVINASAGGISGFLVRLTNNAHKTFQSAPIESKGESFQGLISRSPAMQAVFQIIENAAETTATVLVRGESGSGKELVAKAIHDLSSRRSAPFWPLIVRRYLVVC